MGRFPNLSQHINLKISQLQKSLISNAAAKISFKHLIPINPNMRCFQNSCIIRQFEIHINFKRAYDIGVTHLPITITVRMSHTIRITINVSFDDFSTLASSIFTIGWSVMSIGLVLEFFVSLKFSLDKILFVRLSFCWCASAAPLSNDSETDWNGLMAKLKCQQFMSSTSVNKLCHNLRKKGTGSSVLECEVIFPSSTSETSPNLLLISSSSVHTSTVVS